MDIPESFWSRFFKKRVKAAMGAVCSSEETEKARIANPAFQPSTITVTVRDDDRKKNEIKLVLTDGMDPDYKSAEVCGFAAKLVMLSKTAYMQRFRGLDTIRIDVNSGRTLDEYKPDKQLYNLFYDSIANFQATVQPLHLSSFVFNAGNTYTQEAVEIATALSNIGRRMNLQIMSDSGVVWLSAIISPYFSTDKDIRAARRRVEGIIKQQLLLQAPLPHTLKWTS